MSEDEFKKAIYEAVEKEYENSVPEHDVHVFSNKFERKMKKLIKSEKRLYFPLLKALMRKQ